MLRGIDIILYTKKQVGVDTLGVPVYDEILKTVRNVLIGQPSADVVINELQLSGKRIAYTLAIPKGDKNDWDDVTVEFFGQKFRTYGGVTQGIESMIPLLWNKQVKVERYE